MICPVCRGQMLREGDNLVCVVCGEEIRTHEGDNLRGKITKSNACPFCGHYIPTDDAHDAIFRDEVHFCYFCGAEMEDVTDV